MNNITDFSCFKIYIEGDVVNHGGKYWKRRDGRWEHITTLKTKGNNNLLLDKL